MALKTLLASFKTKPLTTVLLTLWVLNCPTRAQYAGAKPTPNDLRPGFDAVSIDDSKRILTFLSTRCEGRGTGQRGFEKAAKFVANEFKSIGLKPLGDNSTYFQKARVSAPQDLQIDFRGAGGRADFDGKDFVYFLNGGFKFDGPITGSGVPLFIEYGGRPAKLPQATELKGRIVFFHFAGDRFDDPAEGAALDEFFDHVSQAHPAAFFGVLDRFAEFNARLNSGFFHGPRWSLDDEPRATSQSGRANVSARVLPAIAHVAQLATIEVVTPGSVSVTLGDTPLTFEVKGRVDRRWTENVVGLLEGSDLTLKTEYVVVGGHLDHFGIQRGVTFSGADDDGSGATDVIEIARAMAANPRRPRRSIVFVTFFGEEQGLLGSRFFVQHPPVPLDKIVAELQLDMVARDSDGPQQDGPDGGPNPNHVERAPDNADTIRVVGSRKVSTEIDKVVREMNAFVNFRVKDDSEYLFGRSDDANFVKKGIPTAWLFSGFHPDYHQSTDTIDRIDWIKLTNAAKLYYLTAQALADADGRPKIDIPSQRRMPSPRPLRTLQMSSRHGFLQIHGGC